MLCLYHKRTYAVDVVQYFYWQTTKPPLMILKYSYLRIWTLISRFEFGVIMLYCTYKHVISRYISQMWIISCFRHACKPQPVFPLCYYVHERWCNNEILNELHALLYNMRTRYCFQLVFQILRTCTHKKELENLIESLKFVWNVFTVIFKIRMGTLMR